MGKPRAQLKAELALLEAELRRLRQSPTLFRDIEDHVDALAFDADPADWDWLFAQLEDMMTRNEIR